MRTNPKNNKEMGLRSLFSFGMYKDEVLKDIIEDNPKYVRWCIDNVSWFKLNRNAKEYLDLVEENKVDEDLSQAFSDMGGYF